MSIVGYGLGRDTDVSDFLVAMGFGRFVIIAPPPKYIPIRFINQIAAEVRSVSVEAQPCQ